MRKILFILLSTLSVSAISASCPEGVLDGVVHKGGFYVEEHFACFKGKIYPRTLEYCAEKSKDNEKYHGDEGFYSPLDFKCVDGKVIGKNQDYCVDGKLGDGGVYGTLDFYCDKGGIYAKSNGHQMNKKTK